MSTKHNVAAVTAFKNGSLELIRNLRLTDREVIGLAVTMAAAYGLNHDPDELHRLLDVAIHETRNLAIVREAGPANDQ